MSVFACSLCVYYFYFSLPFETLILKNEGRVAKKKKQIAKIEI